MGASDLLARLDDEQRAVAEAISGPIVVLAGAGTGKTTAITHRIAYAVAAGAHDPSRTMAVTFTNRAAGQMRAKLAELGVPDVQVRTFHSAALRQLRYFWPRVAGNRELPRVVSQVQPFFEQAAANAKLDIGTSALRNLADQIEALRMRRLSAAMVRDGDVADVLQGIDLADLVPFWQAYDLAKAEAGVMDFTDVLAVAVGMFTSHPELLREVHRTYRWFTVDEYQDVSPLQWDLLRRWRGESTELCVVGDANQTIYTFAGASPNYLLEFTQEFEDAKGFTLNRCYRSTPPIVECANAVMRNAPTFIELTAQRASESIPTITKYPDDRAEVTAIADRIADAVESGTDPRSIAVLFRTNAQATPFAVALGDRGVPVVTRGIDRFFQRAEVRNVLTRLRTAGDHDLVNAVRTVAQSQQGESDAAESLATLISLSEDFAAQFAEADIRPTVEDFLAHVHERIKLEHAPTPFGVTLSTLHAAKGLEWSTVYLTGCSEGMLPLDGADLDEERRLCYVGVTRAKDGLHLSWAEQRIAGEGAARVITRFLTQATHSVAMPTGPGPGRTEPAPRTKAPARCRVCGRALVDGRERTLLRCARCPASANPALEERLRAWRDQRVRERDVPTFQVLSDAAIEAIAELRPQSVEELLTIPGTRWLGTDTSAVLDLVTDGEAGHPFVKN